MHQTIAQKAETLWEEGYQVMHHPYRPLCYWVLKPNVETAYLVDLRAGCCNCRGWCKWKRCRHFEAVRRLVYEGIAPGLEEQRNGTLIADFYVGAREKRGRGVGVTVMPANYQTHRTIYFGRD